MGLQGPLGDKRFKQTVIRYAIQRIEHDLREGLVSSPPSDTVDVLSLEKTDFPFLQHLLQGKTCAYQHQAGRDLLCTAAGATDTTICGKIDFRAVAPTSRAICSACTLPDTDYVCSHFLHPQVFAESRGASILQRELRVALCDLGQPGIDYPERCHAGGHPCWERLIEPLHNRTAIPLAPLALPEAFDFLDVAWRLAFGKQHALLRLRETTSSAQLSQPCTTREDFAAKLSALADMFKNMDIPDVLLRTPQEIPKDQTFTRLLDCLQGKLDTADYQEVERAVRNLRTVNAVRVGLQHSGAARELPTALATLGIPYPPQWGDTWDRIRAVTIEALRVIREQVLRYATTSP